MKKNLFSHLSSGALVLGAAAGGYALVRIFLLRASLPPGACPVTSYSPLLYTAIGLCAVSFVFSLLDKQKE